MVWLQINNNLSDLSHAGIARSNLGLGEMSTQQPWDVHIYGGDITLPTSAFRLFSSANATMGSVLTLVDESGAMEWRHTDNNVLVAETVVIENIHLGDGSNTSNPVAYGVLVRDGDATTDGNVRPLALTHAFDEIDDLVERELNIPSMSLLFNLRAAIENIGNVASSINTDVFLDRTRNLGDVPDVVVALSNLGVSARVATDTVATKHLRVNMNAHEQRVSSPSDSALFPYFDIGDLDEEGTEGVRARYRAFRVHTSATRDDYNPVSASVVSDMRTTLEDSIATRMSTTMEEFKTPDVWDIAKTNMRQAGMHLVAFTGEYTDVVNTPSNISTFVNDAEYVSARSNLADLYDVAAARHELGLHKVAWTGRLEDLEVDGGAQSIGGFGAGLDPSSNLSEISSAAMARTNLGLSGMAMQEIDQVYITGGDITAHDVAVTKSFTLVPTESTTLYGTNMLDSNVFLCAASSQGEVMWTNLPVASAATIEDSLRPGIVSLTHEFDDLNDGRSNVAASVVATRRALSDAYSNVVENAVHSVTVRSDRAVPLLSFEESRSSNTHRREVELRVGWSEDAGTYLAGDETWGVLTRLSFDENGERRSLMNDIELKGSNVRFRALDGNAFEIGVPTFAGDHPGVVPTPPASGVASVLTESGWASRTEVIASGVEGDVALQGRLGDLEHRVDQAAASANSSAELSSALLLLVQHLQDDVVALKSRIEALENVSPG